MKSWARKTIFAVSAACSALFFFVYFDAFLTKKSCFNEQGRCFDADDMVVHLEQSGVAWLSLALLASGVALYHLWRLTR